MPAFQLRIGDEQRDFDVARTGDVLHLAFDDRTVEARIVHRDAVLTLIEVRREDGTTERLRLAGVRRGDKRLLWANGRSYSAERLRRSGPAHADETGSLSAAIPAVVAQVLVQPGDRVEAGDKLVLLESMKMVIPISAPHDGRVSRVHCRPGDSVPAGAPLLEIESE